MSTGDAGPVSSLNIHSGKAEGETLGTIAFCTRDHLNASTATCLWNTAFDWVPTGYSVQRLIVQGSILTLQRNECLKRMEGDWILFIDDDMVWQPEAVGQLIASWRGLQDEFEEPIILGGLCHRRQEPYDPTLYAREQPTSGRYRFIEKWDTDLVEVDATGAAFLLIPEAALHAIARHADSVWPPFSERENKPPPPVFHWSGLFGEDLSFCMDAKAAGCRIFVDTRIEIGHIAEVTIDRRSFLRSVATRHQETEDLIRSINDTVGLPTMTADEARELLRGG